MEKVKSFVVERLQESSTWTGLGFFIVLCGGKWAADLDWSEAVGLGVFIAKAMSTFLPDKVSSKDE